MGVLRATDVLFPHLLPGMTGSPHIRSSSAMTVGPGGGVGTAAVGWTRCVVPRWLGPSMLGVSYPAHFRVLGWPGAPLGTRNRCPLAIAGERVCCQDGWLQEGNLGSQAVLEHAYILPKYLFHGVGTTSCHGFLMELPCGNGSLVLESPLTSPSHGPFYAPGYSVGSWLVLGLAAPESCGHIYPMSCEPARKHGCPLAGAVGQGLCLMPSTSFQPSPPGWVWWGVWKPENPSWVLGQVAGV